MNNLNIQVGEIYKKYPEGTTFEVIAKDFKDDYKNDIAIAVFNGKLRELSKMPDCDGNLDFLDLSSGTGHRAYKRTATIMFMKACTDCIGEENIGKIKLEFSVNTGYYFSCKGKFKATEELAKEIEEKMKEYVESDIPIIKKSRPLEEAREIFSMQGMEDKLKLCKYRRSSVINLYDLDGYIDYYY
ncbi:MAG: nucleoside kinase, partial [Lachnospiraceae bacterium]|nr:nucleoside kinase [Lachnospiraceae bacterium]